MGYSKEYNTLRVRQYTRTQVLNDIFWLFNFKVPIYIAKQIY